MRAVLAALIERIDASTRSTSSPPDGLTALLDVAATPFAEHDRRRNRDPAHPSTAAPRRAGNQDLIDSTEPFAMVNPTRG
jgi:hypothetical protein